MEPQFDPQVREKNEKKLGLCKYFQRRHAIRWTYLGLHCIDG